MVVASDMSYAKLYKYPSFLPFLFSVGNAPSNLKFLNSLIRIPQPLVVGIQSTLMNDSHCRVVYQVFDKIFNY